MCWDSEVWLLLISGFTHALQCCWALWDWNGFAGDWLSHSRLSTTRHRQGPRRSSPWLHITKYFSVKYTEQNIDTQKWGPYIFFHFYTHKFHAFFFITALMIFWGNNKHNINKLLTSLPLQHLGPLGAHPRFWFTITINRRK